MKIKLNEYSLISNKWIEEQIKNATDKTEFIEQLKQQLTPSEQVAEVYYDMGYNNCSVIEHYKLDSVKAETKQDALNSEIEI